MKAILQRVASASVTIDSHVVSSIGKGVLVFAAVAAEDTRKEVESMAAKVLKMKLWPDQTGATIGQSNLDVLAVSQFTLLASTKKGNKPDFHGAAGGDQAKELYDHFYSKVQELHDPEKVKKGVFQAMMESESSNGETVYHLLRSTSRFKE
ncbi:D-tyrosyl-tRNA(Tyr) deacylase [Lecanora helva]